MANFSDAAEVERSYERNLGYARFWLGAGIAVLSLLFTFGYNLIFSNDDDPSPPSAPPAPEPPPTAELMLETPALFALLALFLFAATCLISGITSAACTDKTMPDSPKSNTTIKKPRNKPPKQSCHHRPHRT